MKAIIFAVEDDPNIQNVIKIALENAQYQVVCFSSGQEMFHALNKQVPSLFLLDVMLPGMDGLQIVQKIKKDPSLTKIPIMIVSAKTSELDKVMGLDIGADDYLIKPFGVLELVSRVKALLRRTKKKDLDIIEVKGYQLDEKLKKLNFQDQSVSLTKKQSQLMKYLLDNEGDVVSRQAITHDVWGYDFVGESRTLDVHIKELRKKLHKISNKNNQIETIHGIGYQLNL